MPRVPNPDVDSFATDYESSDNTEDIEGSPRMDHSDENSSPDDRRGVVPIEGTGPAGEKSTGDVDENPENVK